VASTSATHRDLRVHDVGRVPAAAEPDLDHRGVDRCLSESRVPHAGEHLELAHPDVICIVSVVDDRHVRLDLAVRLHVAVRADRRAVQRDPLGDQLQVRAGEPAHPQSDPGQQRVDHARGRGFAVGAGHLQDRVAVLGVAQHVHQGLDPIERRRDLGLRPTGVQLGFDFAENLQRIGIGHGTRV
jgi:hypothetical protein